MQIIRLPDVISLTKLSRSSVYALIKSGSFPPPIKLSQRAIGWRQDAITNWLDSRPHK